MAASSGNTYLLKVGDAADPEAFVTLAGLRNTSFSFNNSPLDVTTKDSSHYQTLLAAGGVQSFTMSGDGVFQDDANDEIVRGHAFDNSINNYQIVLPSGDIILAAMLIASYETSGANDAEVQFTITLNSSGAPTYTAA